METRCVPSSDSAAAAAAAAAPTNNLRANPALTLRGYQSRIAKTCLLANTIVILPTGSGKTLIAAELIKRLHGDHPTATTCTAPPALFLVPTCILVDQQAKALRSWTGLDVAKYRGGVGLPGSFDVLVSTPEAFKAAQRRNRAGAEFGTTAPLLDWGLFGVVIFDEVHHVLKDHPYRKLALSLRRASLSTRASSSSSSSSSSPSSGNPRVVGLTASYSYAVGTAKTDASLTKMCGELLITKAETATRQELEASGYHATGAVAKVLLPPPLPPPSTSSTVAATTTAPRGVVPPADRKPHEMGITFFRREARGACTAFSRLLMFCVRSMEEAVITAAAGQANSSQQPHPRFASPLPPSGTLAPREWGAYAHKLAYSSSGGESGGEGRVSSTAAGGTGGGAAGNGKKPREAKTCTRCGKECPTKAAGRGGHEHQRSSPLPNVHLLLAELEHWYEAVKTLVVSWEEAEDEATTILSMFGCTGSPKSRTSDEKHHEIWPEHVRQIISAFWAQVPDTFPRYEHLKGVLLDRFDHHGGSGGSGGGGSGGGGGGGGGAGGTSFRGIVFVRQRTTTHALAHVIRNDPRLASRFSTACLYAASSPATASLSVTKAQAQATIEAFRSGRVNLLLATVVAEEGMDVPRANCVIRYDAMVHAVSMVQGRGRAREENSSFVVLDERSDRTTADLEAVERQQQHFVTNFKPPAAGGAADAVALTAQRSRERSARIVLLAAAAKDGGGAVSAVNMFSTKTKADLEESWSKGAGGLWECTLSYESPLRELHAAGTAAGKKAAKKMAAAKLLADLRAAVPA